MPVAGAADALQSGCDRTRRTDLANQIDRADIDSEFERRGRDESLHFAGLQLIFRVETQLAREAAVMRGHRIFSQAFREMMRHSFREAARVYKNERRAMLPNQLGDAVVNLVPHFMRGDRAKFARRNFDGQIERALMPDLHDHRIGTAAAREKMCDQLDWLLRGGEADAHRRTIRRALPGVRATSARCEPRLSSATA